MKAILVNGSRREKGCTFTALSLIAKELNAAGIDTEIYFIGKKVIDGKVDEAVKEAVATAMDASLEEGRQDYLDILEDVQEDVSTAKSVIVEFYDSEDTLIISKEFFAE